MKQFSVFLPNKVGAMLDIVKLLNTQNTHVVALSVSESTDSAIARIIVSDPGRVEKLFREKNVAFGVCEVVVVELREVATQLVKQFSVFLPNKVGAMLDIVKLLNTQNTHVVALSVSESTDSAIARIIVSDPGRVEKLFREKNVAFGVCEVVVVEVREVATQLVKLLAALVMAEVNVHFTYSLLIRPRGFAAIALHVDDTECASSVLMGEGFKMLSQNDISR